MTSLICIVSLIDNIVFPCVTTRENRDQPVLSPIDE